MQHRRKNADAFSLIELLVTLALVSFVGATVVAAVSGCLRVWTRVGAHGDATSWTQLAFDGIRGDLHNIKPFSPIAFDGSYDSVSFPSLVLSGMTDGEDIPEIGQVGYYFDSPHKRLCRAQRAYRFMRRTRLKERCETVLANVRQVRFSYYAPKTDTREAGWESSWFAPEPPVAVKVEVNYDERAVDRRNPDVLLVHVPLAAAR